jgi:hypothetical protein
VAFRRTIVLFATASVFAGLLISVASAQQVPAPQTAVQLIGLTGVKDNAKGTLSVEDGNLRFAHGKARTDLSAASIQDVVTGADSRKSVGKTVGMMSMAAPYGGGRFLSLFRTKIDTLTLQFRDADGALHGVIFTIPAGTAEAFKKELVAQGAHTTAAGEPAAGPQAPSGPSADKERKP